MIDGPVAQRPEQRTHNPLVGGSNPSGPTKLVKCRCCSNPANWTEIWCAECYEVCTLKAVHPETHGLLTPHYRFTTCICGKILETKVSRIGVVWVCTDATFVHSFTDATNTIIENEQNRI